MAAKSSSPRAVPATPGKSPLDPPAISREELGWTRAQVAEARRRLSPFVKEWDGLHDAESSP